MTTRTRRCSETAWKLVAAFFVFTLSGLGASPAAARPFRIGIVVPGDQYLPCVVGFKQGMKNLKHVEDHDVQYFLDNSGGDKARLIEITKKHLADKVSLIFTVTNTALQDIAPLAKPSRTPVVFGSASGPVESGIVPAYATPDAYITGVTSGSIELTEKRLEVLREIFPQYKRIAFFIDVTAESSMAAAAVARKAAPRLGLTLVERRLSNRQEVLEAARKLPSKDADVLFLLPGTSTNVMSELALISKQKKLPFLAFQIEHVKDHGALISYGSSYFLQGKQSARLVSLISKGTPVHQLPIERPEKYELVLNLDTAQAIGVRFSQAVLSRADMIFKKRADG